MAHYPSHQNDRGDRLWPMRWLSLLAITIFYMARSRHLGQVLLRDQIPPPSLLLNLDAPIHLLKISWKEDLTQIADGRRQSRRDETAGGRHCQSRKYKWKLHSLKQIFDRFLLAVFKNVYEYSSLTLVR